MIEAIIERTKESIPEALKQIGGVRPELPKRRMQARWSMAAEEDARATQQIEIATEIVSALATETKAEVLYSAIIKARETAPVAARLVHGSTFALAKEFAETVKTLAANYKQPLAIVTPSQLVLLRLDSSFVAAEESTSDIGPYGKLGNIVLIVDPYSLNAVPALVCETGWFSFDYRDILTVEDVVTNYGERQMAFDTDIIPTVNPDLIQAIIVAS